MSWRSYLSLRSGEQDKQVPRWKTSEPLVPYLYSVMIQTVPLASKSLV